ncbi:MAG: hypothetical protein AAFQ82_19825 [Myxococcota bacterium]
MKFPIVRRMPDGGAIVVDARTKPGVENAWIVSAAGEQSASFYLGDGVEDVLVTSEHVVETYFDEGVYGRRGPNTHGVSAFSHQGKFQFGYTELEGASNLVLLDLRKQAVEIVPLPSSAPTGFSGLSSHGDTFWFHAPYDSYELFSWDLRSTSFELIGQYSSNLRGLPGGRFIATGDLGCTVIDMKSER